MSLEVAHRNGKRSSAGISLDQGFSVELGLTISRISLPSLSASESSLLTNAIRVVVAVVAGRRQIAMGFPSLSATSVAAARNASSERPGPWGKLAPSIRVSRVGSTILQMLEGAPPASSQRAAPALCYGFNSKSGTLRRYKEENQWVPSTTKHGEGRCWKVNKDVVCDPLWGTVVPSSSATLAMVSGFSS